MPLVDAIRMDQVFGEGRHNTPRADADVLFRRARALSREDRLLVELTFQRNLSVRQIGQILQRPAGSVSRRLKSVCRRLRDPLVAALLEPRCALKPEFREIGIEYFAQKREIRALARQRNMTPHQVRAVLNFVRGWYLGVLRTP